MTIVDAVGQFKEMGIYHFAILPWGVLDGWDFKV